jgi:hypothetical protein
MRIDSRELELNNFEKEGAPPTDGERLNEPLLFASP